MQALNAAAAGSFIRKSKCQNSTISWIFFVSTPIWRPTGKRWWKLGLNSQNISRSLETEDIWPISKNIWHVGRHTETRYWQVIKSLSLAVHGIGRLLGMKCQTHFDKSIDSSHKGGWTSHYLAHNHCRFYDGSSSYSSFNTIIRFCLGKRVVLVSRPFSRRRMTISGYTAALMVMSFRAKRSFWILIPFLNAFLVRSGRRRYASFVQVTIRRLLFCWQYRRFV